MEVGGACVSQASFEPLGLTVAVAKDRAIESLMQVGDTFVLNCLGEGQYGPLMKVRHLCALYLSTTLQSKISFWNDA